MRRKCKDRRWGKGVWVAKMLGCCVNADLSERCWARLGLLECSQILLDATVTIGDDGTVVWSKSGMACREQLTR